ncbi:MAG TPA: carboxypeptidase-like regulatory domain-containing protein [Candidatus Binatia bacterium]
MKNRQWRSSWFLISVVATLLALSPHRLSSQQTATIEIDNDDIAGVVTSTKGAEGGVWVIAESHELPTRFARMVVTDERGRYLIPNLPKANYDVWVRGYGLVDSPKVKSAPGKMLNLKAVIASNEAAAAQYYPAIYWYSMMKIPDKSEFGDKGKIPGRLTQNAYLNLMKSNGCANCHSIGNRSMRTFPTNVPHPFGKFANSQELWFRRIQSGQGGVTMFATVMKEMGGAPLPYLADWTDRIAKGELPHAKPARPEGAERNLVVTTWDWLDQKHYLHDLIASDRRFPTVNADGPLYGSTELSVDAIPVLDPKNNTVTQLPTAVRDDNTPMAMAEGPMQASPYWGEERVWTSKVNNHNAMFDRKGRVWLAAAIRGSGNPAFCKKGSDHPSAKAFPVERSSRHLAILDPKTKQYTFIDTCFGTHHLQFDANDVLWTSGGGQVLGWFDMKKFDETGDTVKSQGWTPMILDTNGNGKRDEYVEPNQPVDPTKDKRISAPFYAVMPSPADGTVWGSIRTFPGAVVRIVPGPNPSETALAEIYNIPLPGFGIRGADIDKQGVIWASLASGHLASFDRRKCKGPLNGPKATGDHCPEGWSFYQYPGPGFQGIGENSAESSYYSWVDQHNTFGLGEDVPMSTANLENGLVAFKDGKMILLRVPYPLGFYAKGFDGRIDDPKAGWKGRGLWSSSGDRAPWLMENGKGSKPLAVHFQLRPDPLAK